MTTSMQKNLKYQLTLSRGIDDQGLWQSDWMRGTHRRTQPKVVVSDDIFT